MALLEEESQEEADVLEEEIISRAKSAYKDHEINIIKFYNEVCPIL